MDSLEEVELDRHEKFTYILSFLANEERAQLQITLLRNIDVFVWRHSDMVGISPTTASHKLNILPATKPLRQRVRMFHLNQNHIIQTEVDNLLSTRFIREVKYPKWLANAVVVPKGW